MRGPRLSALSPSHQIVILAWFATLLSACAGPVRTTVRPWEPPAGRESLAEDLQHATPATVLNFARAAWGAATPGGPLSDSLESSINLATATIVRRLPEEAAAFEAAGLTLPPRLARGVAVEARSIGIVGISTRFERPGLGVPLSLETPAQARSNTAAKLPPEGQFVPATAVLTFDARACSVLSLVDPRKFEAVSVADDSIPLAADFTAPYARLLGETEIFLEGRLGILEAFAPERQGLFLLEPYDPDKIPLVMVHGLGGSPIGWRELTNRIFGTPDLRRRFQVWHYYYPTGTPYLWAGKEFREALDAALIELRIGTEDKSNDDVVLVGHSMGGMLVKTAVSNTGSLLWDLAFRVPPEQLDVREDDRETLRRVFVFERLPYVTRAVFVMSPHRGSEVAQSWFARFGTSLITLPPHFIGLFRRLAEADPEGVRPEFIELFRRGGPSSVEALRADHPLFPTLAEVPIDSAVQTHNIIGDVGDGTDGVVTKESAFLLGAASSAVLPVAHQNLEDPRVTESIVRILYQHAAVNKSESRERTFTPNPCPDR